MICAQTYLSKEVAIPLCQFYKLFLNYILVAF